MKETNYKIDYQDYLENDYQKSPLGRGLAELRQENNFSQKQIAKLLNISVSTYANWEQGRRQIGVLYLKEIAKIYQIDMNSLFEYFN